MKHTSLIPMDSCSREGRNPNVLKNPPDSGGRSKLRLLLRCFGLVLFLFSFSTSLSAQKILTGSGSTTCNGSFNFGSDQTGGVFYEDDVTLGRQEFVVCPGSANQNTHLAKLAITSFDVAPGDTISIYEGCGTAGNLLSGFPYYGGGASAATSLPSSWFLAQCEGDGCLTVVFAPNGDNNKGAGIDFETSCEPRMTMITCPNDVVEAAFCDPTTGTISGNHTIQGLSGTCNVTPTIVAAELFTVPVSGIVVTTGSTPTTISLSTPTTIGAVEHLTPGNYSVRMIYRDVSGTTADPNDTCAYNIIVDSGITPVCNDNVNISLSGGCQAVITVDNILEGNHECASDFVVQLLEGENKDTNIVNASYLGTTTRVQVVEPTSGNRCWGFVTVENKLSPVLNCRDMSIFCSTTTDPAVIGGQPTTADICSGNVTFNFTDEERTFSCKPGQVLTTNPNGSPLTVDPDTIGLVVRTWTAVDGNGNLSFPCTQNIFVLKPQIVASDIIWPSDTILYCGDGSDSTPAITGSPLVKIGDEIISLDQSCFFGLSHQDQVFTASCEGSQKIVRTWTILDWCHPGTVFTNAINRVQLIQFADTLGPIITDVPFFNDITITNAGHDCGVSLEIPSISVSDACSSKDNINVRVVGPSNTIFSNGGTMPNIPFGTHNIVYIAEDDCGNISTDTVSITVKDAVSPTVICKESLAISLTQDGTAWAFASAFDDGSHDNCGIDSMRVRRMETCASTAFPNAAEWSNSVPLECCDIGESVMISLGVWDHSGNFNNCMVRVRVIDKVQATIVCPPDLTIDCTADSDDLSVFGNATMSGGNCNTATLGAATVVRNINNCGAGTIVRTWTLGDATCSQTITVELSPTESIQVDSIPEEIMVNCNNVDLSIYDDGNDLTFTSVGCQSIAVNYHRTDFFGEAGSCRRIVREWEVIDWCINPNALVDADGDGYKGPGYKKVTQVVRVMDTEGPVIYSNNTPVGNGPLVFDGFQVRQSTCQAAEVVLPSLYAIDNCSDGVLPVSVSGTIGSHVLVNATPSTLTNIPVGTYTLFYSAQDGCGNRSVVEVQIVITDNLGPAMFCIDEIAVNLGVSGATGASIDVWASDFACKIEDCSALGELVLAYPANNTGVFEAVPPTHADSNGIFTCEDLGRRNVDIWARDINGNWSVVTVVITVQDNLNLCPAVTGNTGTGNTGTGNTGTGSTGTGSTGTGNTGTGNTGTNCSVSFRALPGAGVINVSMATGTLPYTVSWSGASTSFFHLTSGNSYTIPSLIAGTYNVIVTDANGCFSTQSITVGAETQAAIRGKISNEMGASVENVVVNLDGFNGTSMVTGSTGDYEFSSVPMHNDYTITPEKETNPLNGVSTFDLVLISKHILGIQDLDTPYKRIAADINRSGTITAFDMVQLRQLILNITAEYPNNDSWRFVDANYQFVSNNPENESFAEIAAINDLSADNVAHFVAVKIGDVSGNAAANTLASSESRSFNGMAAFSMEDQTFVRGEQIEVSFKLKDIQDVLGYQFTLDIDPAIAKIVELTEGIANEANFGLMNIDRGQLTTSWNRNEAVNLEDDMFTLVLKANQGGRLSEIIQLNSELTAKEAYSPTGQLLDVVVDFGATDKVFKLYQNTPNPFKDVTTISFDLPAATTVQLTIFDVSGKLMKSISGEFNEGYNEVQINKSELAENGVYFYNLETADHVAKKRMILID